MVDNNKDIDDIDLALVTGGEISLSPLSLSWHNGNDKKKILESDIPDSIKALVVEDSGTIQIDINVFNSSNFLKNMKSHLNGPRPIAGSVKK